MSRWSRLAIAGTAVFVLAGWGTVEHIGLGARIAAPFEGGVVGGALPVIVPDRGPKTYAHWVSAPDFGRGLLDVVDGIPLVGDLACSVLWDADGLQIGGIDLDDQTFAAADEGEVQADLYTQRAILDCLNVWRLNNSHFGDAAATHYLYYHGLAIEAARRYRRSRVPECRAAAYTLEAWGGHYLTDSTAAGHAWNPPGRYDSMSDFLNYMTITGPGVRMRIHDALNATGARMAGERWNDGLYHGDGSRRHLDEGAQRELTLLMAQRGLGQIVSAAECGASPDASEARPEDHPFVANADMCRVMWGHEVKSWVPDTLEFVTIQDDEVRDVLGRCGDDEGALATRTDGRELAESFFRDEYDVNDGPMPSTAIDEEAEVALEDLGCPADAEPRPAAGATDACGNVLCEVPAGDGDACPSGLSRSGGCCHAAASGGDDVGGGGDREPMATDPSEVLPRGDVVDMGAPGVATGDASDFLWLADAGAHASLGELEPLAERRSMSMGGDGPPILACGRQARFRIFETTVSVPDSRLTITIRRMDEGLRVQVDGELVAYLRQGSASLRVPLLAGEHLLRFTQVNDCDEEQPLELELTTGDPGETGVPGTTSGCSSSPGRPDLPAGPLVLALLLLGAVIWGTLPPHGREIRPRRDRLGARRREGRRPGRLLR